LVDSYINKILLYIMSIQWKDLFNQKTKPIESPIDIVSNHLKSSGLSIYITEKIPQSVIKKSKKDAYKNYK
jgi:hypothetical protein